MIRVAIADDHAIVRQGIARLVGAEPDLRVVAEVGDGIAAVACVAGGAVDVLVLDLSLPGLDGLEVLRRLREAGHRAAVVVLTMYPEDRLALQVLRAGATAYLSKTRPPEELLAAIRRAAEGYGYLTDTLAALRRTDASDRLPHQRLTAREYQVFIQLVGGATVSEVAHALEISVSTASNHVAAIREKLGAASIGEILRYAARVGLMR